MLLRGMYHGTHVADISQPCLHDYQRVSNRPASTPEHKSTWNCSYTNTLTPVFTLPAACTKHKPQSLLYWNRKIDGSKKGAKVRENRVAMFGQACVRTRWGGGGLMYIPPLSTV